MARLQNGAWTPGRQGRPASVASNGPDDCQHITESLDIKTHMLNPHGQRDGLLAALDSLGPLTPVRSLLFVRTPVLFVQNASLLEGASAFNSA
jgi:hypothetical protein